MAEKPITEAEHVVQAFPGHGDTILVVSNRGNVFQRVRDNKDYSPRPRFLWMPLGCPKFDGTDGE